MCDDGVVNLTGWPRWSFAPICVGDRIAGNQLKFLTQDQLGLQGQLYWKPKIIEACSCKELGEAHLSTSNQHFHFWLNGDTLECVFQNELHLLYRSEMHLLRVGKIYKILRHSEEVWKKGSVQNSTRKTDVPYCNTFILSFLRHLALSMNSI